MHIGQAASDTDRFLDGMGGALRIGSLGELAGAVIAFSLLTSGALGKRQARAGRRARA